MNEQAFIKTREEIEAITEILRKQNLLTTATHRQILKNGHRLVIPIGGDLIAIGTALLNAGYDYPTTETGNGAIHITVTVDDLPFNKGQTEPRRISMLKQVNQVAAKLIRKGYIKEATDLLREAEETMPEEGVTLPKPKAMPPQKDFPTPSTEQQVVPNDKNVKEVAGKLLDKGYTDLAQEVLKLSRPSGSAGAIYEMEDVGQLLVEIAGARRGDPSPENEDKVIALCKQIMQLANELDELVPAFE